MSENSAEIKRSFSLEIKDELLSDCPGNTHCALAEIAGITQFLGIKYDENIGEIILNTDSEKLSKNYFTLIGNTIKITEYCKNKTREKYTKICELFENNDYEKSRIINSKYIKENCCKRAYLKGVFLAAGYINDPNKAYHLEIVSDSEKSVMQVCDVLCELGILSKMTTRKNQKLIYIKDGSMIVDFLGMIGASLGLMKFEDIRIRKSVNNDLNRKINFEVANIKKTVSAAMAQIEDIEYIENTVGLSELPKSLLEVAKLRLEYPQASLSELGDMMSPVVGKSGINHRLRRISQYAKNIRKEDKKYEKGNSD